MIEVTNRTMCSGCTACAGICPQNCIVMSSDKMGFLYPVVDTNRCIDCGLCEAVCPRLKDLPQTSAISPEAYFAVGRDSTVREMSSSGGVFFNHC